MSNRLRTVRNSLFLALISVLFNLRVAPALQEKLIYKDTRPLKKVSEVEKETGKEQAKTKAEKEGRYIYDPTGKIDPFKSFIAEQEEIEEKKKRKPKTYLETLDLSQLELTAIIVSPKGNWAMVRDSKGLGHMLQKGTAIGTNNGVVYQIKDQEVIIREEHRDFRGRTRYKDVVKKLPSLQ